MNIGINASYLEYKRGGVARFVVNLLKLCPIIAPDNKYYLYFRDNIPDDDFLDHRCFEKQIIKCPDWLDKTPVWENIFLAKEISKNKKLNLFFSPSYTLPILFQCQRKVVHIFDISYITHPEWYPSNRRLYDRVSTCATIKNADLVTTSSCFTKKELISVLHVPEEKVAVFPIAIDKHFNNNSNIDMIKTIKDTYSKGRDYILFLGLLTQRRNMRTLLEAFKQNRINHRTHHCLLLVGANRMYPFVDIRELISEMGLEENVFWYQNIDDEILPTLYQGASVFIYPSSYEGFGIPPLEAMACGVPVITSNLSSLPEVVGDAAYLLDDPSNVNEVSEALMKMLALDSISKHKFINKGLAQAKKYSWQRTIKDMLKTMGGLVDNN
jgi:glycosyltransferase involved in cell wall biosynthesis